MGVLPLPVPVVMGLGQGSCFMRFFWGGDYIQREKDLHTHTHVYMVTIWLDSVRGEKQINMSKQKTKCVFLNYSNQDPIVRPHLSPLKHGEADCIENAYENLSENTTVDNNASSFKNKIHPDLGRILDHD